ncbi:hypothetical protein KC644_01975, partial [Candidatus Berkelbacteria bacterium]|nr:hypothetical protein [Candidatus Berkelbacteria bacterium]
LCGGPSFERGISLNSARSAMDNLQASDIEIIPIYFDQHNTAYELSRPQLYSNTPSDFDFKLAAEGKTLPEDQLIQRLKGVDVVFPAIHGKFGEDGELQELLEENQIEFIGSGAGACRDSFDKYNSTKILAANGFHTIPSALVEFTDEGIDQTEMQDFFRQHQLNRVVVKPARAGSSIGVFTASTPREALRQAKKIFNQGIDNRIVIEPFVAGVEFTMIILEGDKNQPVALIPTEVEIDYSENQIFDYRKKYLPTRQVTWHSPPRFAPEVTAKIKTQGEQIFKLFGMRDVARFDGWVLENGEIWFSDFNPISGMEQNSFLFLQAAQLGMSREDVLRYLISRGCQRQGHSLSINHQAKSNHQPVNIIFGGDTAERQVSVMSGTNVWLKLCKSNLFDPEPHLLDNRGDVWHVPYCLTMHHTVEEMAGACQNSKKLEAKIAPLRTEIKNQLGIKEDYYTQKNFIAKKSSLDDFIASSPLVFIALHGGIGENGQLQQKLEQASTPYTGSDSVAAALCMDKFKTGKALLGLENQGIHTLPKLLTNPHQLRGADQEQIQEVWKRILSRLKCHSVIVKPIGDGCSAGIARLYTSDDLIKYLRFLLGGFERIPSGTLKDQNSIIELPTSCPENIMFEKFVETDQVLIVDNEIFWKPKTGWIEVTIGVYGEKGNLKAMNPSVTIASGSILSVEEKFQGGTGVNITPPPTKCIPKEVTKSAKKRLETVANRLGINGFARIDAFMNIKNGELIIIEANSIPGLTPSTVIYHQALAESEPMYPTQFLEKILSNCSNPTTKKVSSRLPSPSTSCQG